MASAPPAPPLPPHAEEPLRAQDGVHRARGPRRGEGSSAAETPVKCTDYRGGGMKGRRPAAAHRLSGAGFAVEQALSSQKAFTHYLRFLVQRPPKRHQAAFTPRLLKKITEIAL